MQPYDQLITIVDSFFEDGEAMRRLALEQEYVAPPSQRDPAAKGPIANRVPCPQAIVTETLARLAHYCTGTVVRASIEFRYTTQATIKRQVCHADGVAQAGIVHLTPAHLCQGGTDFFRHKPTGDLWRQPGQDALYDYRNPDDWEWLHRAEMAFNRLVFYPGDLFHAPAVPFFGDRIENARLTQNIFLHTE